MYNQGNFLQSFPNGMPNSQQQAFPQTPPPPLPYRQTLPGPPPTHFHQAPPPPPRYHAPHAQQQFHPPPAVPMNMGGTSYVHPLPPPPIQSGNKIVAPYTQPGHSYHPPVQAQSTFHVSHVSHVSQPLPPPPPLPAARVVAPPPLSQGQVMFRAPPPPPPGIHHVPAPPPPQPSTFISITPAPFVTFGQHVAEEVHPPSFSPPPPPPPPSSPPPRPPSPPPPLPLSPPPSTSSSSGHKDMSAGTRPGIKDTDILSSPFPYAFPVVDVSPDRTAVEKRKTSMLDHQSLDVEERASLPEEKTLVSEKIPLVGGQTQDLISHPPKPIDEETVRNIEALCQFIEKVGPTFEEEARMREAGNPQFSFLFGGEPGSKAAIGHAYFLRMKEEKLKNKANRESVAQSTTFQAVPSTDSDMDMDDDDVRSDHGLESECLNEDLRAAGAHDRKGLLSSTQDIMEQLPPEVAMNDIDPCLTSSTLVKDEKESDDGCSLSIEDRSSIPNFSAQPEGATDVKKAFSRSTSGDSSLDKMLPAAAGYDRTEVSRVFVEDGSPFRLIQGYASDDSDDGRSQDHDDVLHCSDPSAITIDTSIEQDQRSDLHPNPSPNLLSNADIHSEDGTGLVQTSHAVKTEVDASVCSPSKNATLTAVVSGCDVDTTMDITDQCIEVQQESVKMDGAGVNVVQQTEKDANVPANISLDEFGRLVRKDTSDSDSEADYNERPCKRGRSWDQSPSPQANRQRQIISPGREQHSHSRSSFSRRSRSRSKSRSPVAFRRTSEFARRDRDQRPECFNFVRGRCFRGGSCPYVHPDLRQHQGKRQTYQEAGNSKVHKTEYASSPSGKSHQKTLATTEINVKENSLVTQTSQSLAKDGSLDEVLLTSKPDEEKCRVEDEDILLTSETVNEIASTRLETHDVGKEQETNKACVAVESTQAPFVHSLLIESAPGQVAAIRNDISVTKPQSSQENSHMFSGYDPKGQQASLQLPVPSDFPPPSLPASGASYQAIQIQSSILPGPAPISYRPHPSTMDMSGRNQSPLPGEYHFYSVASSSSWSNYSSQPSHVSGPTSWPAFHAGVTAPLQVPQSIAPSGNSFPAFHSGITAPLQAPQGSASSGNDFVLRPNQPGELPHPLGSGLQSQHFRPMESAGALFHVVEPRPWHIPIGNVQNQAFARDHQSTHSLIPHNSQMMSESQREQHLYCQNFPHEAGSSVASLNYAGPSSFHPGNGMHPQSQVGPRELSSQPHSMSVFRVPPNFSSRDEFPHSLNRDACYPDTRGPHMIPSNLSTDTFDPNKRHSSSFTSDSLPSLFLDIGVGKVSAHYNPFASTFERPLFASGIGGNDLKNIGAPPSSEISMEQLLQKVTGAHSVAPSGSLPLYAHESSSEVPSVVHKQILKESADGDAYDPLFDSIEPSPSVVKKADASRDPAIQDLVSLSKANNSIKLAEIENNVEPKGTDNAAPKSEADELGEVATDAEIGIVENGSPQLDDKDWSPGILFDMDFTATGEIETDQVLSPGKSKKRKESRSMKLFKVALADFVKEVLKPSWRQGNMSKEAFKTIVKKTVDKVAGSMSSHQIPKSQAKINLYVQSSQRKLTKLVMGYVDKYVKI